MARNFKPAAPFNVPMSLLPPIYRTASGVEAKTFPDITQGILFYGSVKTYGGTEKTVDGIYSIEDTATVECWYKPEIKSDCRVAVLDTGAVYDILGEPENINMRNQYLRFKIRRIKGGA